MPFKSQAQRRKFADLLVKGKISQETFEEWNRETGSAKLPEHVKPKAKKKRTRLIVTERRPLCVVGTYCFQFIGTRRARESLSKQIALSG